MIDEPLIYLVVERIKQMNSSGISVEELIANLIYSIMFYLILTNQIDKRSRNISIMRIS